MDGKPLSARARRAAPARDPGDVRLQERQVGRADRRSAPSRAAGYWEQRGYDADAWVGRSNGALSAGYVRRFSRTERAVHWVHASAFFVLLATGLVLYVPCLSEQIGRRPLVKEVHLLHRGRLGRRARARRRPRRPPRAAPHAARARRVRRRRPPLAPARPAPQGRFNAGQKLNAALTAAFALALRRLRARCSGSASATRASASTARSSSTTG